MKPIPMKDTGRYIDIWETIEHTKESGFFTWTERAEVPGGWIVRSTIAQDIPEARYNVSLAFVPDKEHRWDLDD